MTTEANRSISRRRAAIGLAAVLLGSAALLLSTGQVAGASAKVANPIPYSGNLSCADFGFAYELKIDAQPVAGTYAVGDPGVVTQGSVPAGATITISNVESPGGRMEFDWSSNVSWGAVLVKQGDGGLRYPYDPAASNDQNVQTVTGANQGGISHVSFCGPGNTTTTSESPTTSETPTTAGTPTTASVLGTVVTQAAPTTAASVLGVQVERTLPATGAGSNGLLGLLGVGLVVAGAGLLGAARWRLERS